MGVRKEEEEGVIMMHAWSDRMVSSRSGRTGFPIQAENRFKKHVRVIHAVDWGGTVIYREFGGGDKTLPAIQTLHNTASLMQPQHKARRLLTPCKWILQSARCCILHAWWITPFINHIIPMSTAVNAAELPECKVRRVIWLNIWIHAQNVANDVSTVARGGRGRGENCCRNSLEEGGLVDEDQSVTLRTSDRGRREKGLGETQGTNMDARRKSIKEELWKRKIKQMLEG